jgi:hypothetical protein
MTSDPGRPGPLGQVHEWSDEDLIDAFRYLKSETAQGDADRDQPLAQTLEVEMRRRGLRPDREDVIPDDPPSDNAGVKPAH